MKKNSVPHTSQDFDRKHQQDHVSNNSRAAKDTLSSDDIRTIGMSEETAELISKGHAFADKPPLKPAIIEDKRETARHEHTHHFTNRAGQGEK